MIDNGVENVSICSWEAVDERSGPPSGASSTNAISSSVLWVPDHAVSRCTSCQTEFWLGRRKHHCRSCGQIFCADCSEYWAALPDERLFTPVRLCAPCFNSVTTKYQNHEQPHTIPSYSQCTQSIESCNSNQHYTNGTSTMQTTSVTSTNTLEPCKHSMSSTKNDQSPTKATTVTN